LDATPDRTRERKEHAMITQAATLEQPTVTARDVIDRFVDLVAAQDLDGIVALYAPGARWDVHVPGWDGVAKSPVEYRDFHYVYFVEHRDAFSVDGYQLAVEGDTAALRWDLSWTDRRDGARCVSFQCHFFEVHSGLIFRHHMYCAGVRADEC
jgi:ketosteroid isomerase-like protein